VIAANLEARAVRDYSPRVRFVAFSSKACHRTAHLLASGKRVKTTI
jgi:23S rRNA maturation mini-RNase III